MCEVRKLSWDSAFFNKNVYQIFYCNNCNLNIKIKDLFTRDEAELIYLFSTKQVPHSINFNTLNGQLVDTKILLEKAIISKHDDIDFSPISVYNSNKVDRQLYSLAFQSGIESRFRKDVRLPSNSFQRMYEIWIEKSVNHELADIIFVFKMESEIAGFITLKLNNEIGRIGLFAVDEKNRGKKIGKILLQRAERYVYDNNYNSLIIPTQERNISACNFYKSNGYSIKERTFIYHFINNKTK